MQYFLLYLNTMRPNFNYLIFTMLLSALVISTSAQDYRPIPKHARALYFDVRGENVFWTVPDSVSAMNDSLLLMLPFWVADYQGNYTYLRKVQNGMLGDSLRMLPNGMYKSKVVGRYAFQWDFRPGTVTFQVYNGPEGIVQATLIASSLQTLFTTDSVLQYQISSTLPGMPNSYDVWISKNYGVIKSEMFFFEPIPNQMTFRRTVTLAGMKTGNSSLGQVDEPIVVNYQTGDVYGYMYLRERRDQPSTYEYVKYTLLQLASVQDEYQIWMCRREIYDLSSTLVSVGDMSIALPLLTADSNGTQALYWDGSPTSYGHWYYRERGSLSEFHRVTFRGQDSVLYQNYCSPANPNSSNLVFHTVLGKFSSRNTSMVRSSCSEVDAYDLVYAQQSGQIWGGEPVTTSTLETSGSGFSVYPNPANEVLNVFGVDGDEFSYTITTLSGQMILNDVVSVFQSKAQIKINHLNDGIYLFYSHNGTKPSRPFKFIKRH